MIDILDRYIADISEERRRELLGRYLSLEDDSLFSILGDRLAFGLRDDWELRDALPEKELADKGRSWFEQARPGLQKVVRDAWRDDIQGEDNLFVVQAVMDILKGNDEKSRAPVLILAILLVKGGF